MKFLAILKDSYKEAVSGWVLYRALPADHPGLRPAGTPPRSGETRA